MNEKQVRPHILPSAAPSDDDIADWEAMTRDEQLDALRAVVDSPEAHRESALTMDDLLARARTRLLEKSHA